MYGAIQQELICTGYSMDRNSGTALLICSCARYGITSKSGVRISFDEYKQREYDKLADVIRENMDMKYIYEIIG